ncbi:pyridoxamine 5'-phosphate oxidase family protein [Ruegeria sp. HKCCA6837]|uniref:pyridoxamine 5'-phosphate oxidase family protein n=1 Tax=Ruegeria sp. HKCCA6837 TaxID=2682989 RepID=UPI0014880F63|nr:pyridoxamine 5'-phosphate oxidase family protein [Ruegeria sp. HKCCA6837]
MVRPFAEISFTPSVRETQAKNGSATGYAKFLAGARQEDLISPVEASFIAQRDGFYQATVSETGWPYVQFRGGPVGFLKVLDERTLAYADFRGNRQYLSSGNLLINDRISLILMDYPNQRRLKIWGRAMLIDAETDPALMRRLSAPGYRAHPERAIVIKLEAMDWNCPQHIPQRLTLEEFEDYLAPFRTELAALKARNARLEEALGQQN